MTHHLILGGTGKTGRRVADRLRAAGASVRTAARHGADVRFDWDDPATYPAALAGAETVYLVPPELRLDYAPPATDFVELAAEEGVGHVTFLSARGVDAGPPDSAARQVERHLLDHPVLSATILRPGWFMHNFSESFFAVGIPAGVIEAPSGDGAEAFVHVDDIADAAVASLLDPARHAGATYTLTGPAALTFGEVAARISAVAGHPVRHVDADPGEWIAGLVAAGVPADYAGLLAGLLGALREGAGSTVVDGVERATGQQPRSFDDYLAEVAPTAAWATASSAAD